MKKLILGLVMIGLVFGLAGVAMAANTDSHSVTVTVSAINEIDVSGGNLTLTINAAAAGEEPAAVSDSTTCGLVWTTNEASKKITVQSNLASPTFTLKALATGVSGGGSAASEVTFSNASVHDFVAGIATEIGGCNITYTASATAAQGTGSDVHTITYTITDSV